MTISFRADGSSRYSEGNKWGYFPSAALAWKIGDEDFMQEMDVISDLNFVQVTVKRVVRRLVLIPH